MGFDATQSGPVRSDLALLFPGQGSQTVGMLEGFAGNDRVAAVMAQAGEALGEDLSALIAQGPAEALSLTRNTQPAMLASDLAFFAAYVAAGGPRPSVLAGHSLGEYAALTAAGVFDLADAVRAVRFRAEAMQSAVPVGVGAMAAVLGLEGERVDEICRGLSSDAARVEAVNFNAPDQTVIAGHRAAVEQASEALKAAGAKRALLLPVSAPFHSSLLRPAADALRSHLQGLKLHAPSTPVVQNIDAQPAQGPSQICEALAQQAMSPVLWVATLHKLWGQGVRVYVECGPGKVLSGLVKRTLPEAQILNIADEASLRTTLDALAASAA